MENVALSDSNDDLVDEIIEDPTRYRAPIFQPNEQQKVASELQDAANTDVTKATFNALSSTSFKPLFPSSSTGGSPVVFQQVPPPTSIMNPLLQQQQTMSTSAMPSPSIQTNIRPPSAFTPLVSSTNSQSMSSIQPKLIIGNQSTSFSPVMQPVQFQNPQFTHVVGAEPVNNQMKSLSDTHFTPLPPPPPRPPSSSGPPISTNTSSSNPYSARASLNERIYPSMPTSQAPLQPQQLPPPVSFQQQQQQQQTQTPQIVALPTSNLFMPPAANPINPIAPTSYTGTDTNFVTPTYQPPVPNTDPWSTYTSPNLDQQNNQQLENNQAGLWGWLSGNKVLASVVEKAKTGLETVITTMDPQMKQYIQPGQPIHIVVTSAKDVKLTPVRDAFTQVFGRVITQGIGVQSNVAPQPVGFEAGFKGAQQRIENLRRQNVVSSDQCIVSIENFIAELVPDMYFDLGYVLLSDPLNSIELHLFTQAIPIPIEYVYQARDRTPADYPLKWSGYLATVGEILHSQMPFINPEDWHETMSGTSRRDIIYAACKSLAYMYKQRLNRNQS